MSALKFIDGELPETPVYGKWNSVRAELRTRPGVWAEFARGPRSEAVRIRNRGLTVVSRHSDLECRSQIEGAEIVCYVRAVAP